MKPLGSGGGSYLPGICGTYAFPEKTSMGPEAYPNTAGPVLRQGGIPPLFRTLSIGGKMISEVSDGTKEIHDGV